MKKTSYIILSLLILLTLLFGCTQNEKLSIRICGYSDSIPENPHKLEYQDWSKDAFIDSDAEKKVTVEVGNIHTTGDYVKTEHRFSEFYNTRIYKDDNDRYFSITDDGKLCNYFFGDSSSDESGTRTYTESECLDIACAFLSKITDISKYTVTTTFNEDRKMYTISFNQYVNGFKCSDQAEIVVKETGHIYSFSSTMLGRIPVDAETNFNREAIQTQIIAKLDKEYVKAKAVYDTVSYDNFSYELTIDERGHYALICTIDVRCINSHDGYDDIVSERIRLLIQ